MRLGWIQNRYTFSLRPDALEALEFVGTGLVVGEQKQNMIAFRDILLSHFRESISLETFDAGSIDDTKRGFTQHGAIRRRGIMICADVRRGVLPILLQFSRRGPKI